MNQIAPMQVRISAKTVAEVKRQPEVVKLGLTFPKMIELLLSEALLYRRPKK